MKDYCYEMCVIFSPNIENDRERHYSRLRELLEKEGVELLAEKDWGMRKFAYPIQKHTNGFYSFFYFKAEKQVPRMIAEDFKMQEDVLRHMIIKKTIGKDINLESILRDENDFSNGRVRDLTSDDYDSDYDESPEEVEEAAAPSEEEPAAPIVQEGEIEEEEEEAKAEDAPMTSDEDETAEEALEVEDEDEEHVEDQEPESDIEEDESDSDEEDEIDEDSEEEKQS